MKKRNKRLVALLSNPKEVRFEDACSAEAFGFVKKGGKGSHCTYGRADESILLNFQNRDGLVKPYQTRQLIKMVKKYGDST